MGGHFHVQSDPSAEALDILEQLGLTEYEAKCFIGLTQVSSASASELSKLTDVPRSRVYDIADRLSQRGLIEVQQGDTTRYRAISIESAINKLQRKYQSHLADLEDLLYDLDRPAQESDATQGVWTIRGRENVIERAQELCDRSSRELFLLFSSPDLIDKECLRRIQRANNRGARVIVVTRDGMETQFISEAVTEAIVVEPSIDWLRSPAEDGSIARIVMADRSAVLIATTNGDHGDMTETVGVIASGSTNGLVTVASTIAGNWIDASLGPTPQP